MANRLENFGRQTRKSGAEMVLGEETIRLLVADYRKAEMHRLAERDRRYVMAGFKWTVTKLQRRHVCTGKLTGLRH